MQNVVTTVHFAELAKIAAIAVALIAPLQGVAAAAAMELANLDGTAAWVIRSVVDIDTEISDALVQFSSCRIFYDL